MISVFSSRFASVYLTDRLSDLIINVVVQNNIFINRQSILCTVRLRISELAIVIDRLYINHQVLRS